MWTMSTNIATPVPATSTLTAGSVPSCLRNKNNPQRKHPIDRRVSFPEDNQRIVTGFLEPANPWEYGKYLIICV